MRRPDTRKKNGSDGNFKIKTIMNILPTIIGMQTYYTLRKSRKLGQCEDCKYYKGMGKKCKDGRIPELDWKYCPENYG